MAVPDLRFLHFVLKIADRKNAIKILRDSLRMKVLRHEEFSKGCEATCNGPYAGRWSKTMIGYGPEDTTFVLELTYNYGVEGYVKGNDFRSMSITYEGSDEKALKELPLEGYKLLVPSEWRESETPLIRRLCLSSSNLDVTHDYWTKHVGLEAVSRSDQSVVFRGRTEPNLALEFVKVDAVDRGEAFGRIAFACPGVALPSIEKALKESNQTILNPLISLDTPGKATVQVVIAADPDGHEICFVGDEGFRELSVVDPGADAALNKEIENDKSAEWAARHKRKPKQ